MKLLAIVASLAAVWTGEATAQATWNLPTPYGDSFLVTKTDQWFADEVEKRTDGALKINLHTGSSLYQMPEILPAIRSGQVQIGEIVLSSYSNENPVFALENIPL